MGHGSYNLDSVRTTGKFSALESRLSMSNERYTEALKIAQVNCIHCEYVTYVETEKTKRKTKEREREECGAASRDRSEGQMI